MKASFILHARDKAKHVAYAARSMMAQVTREPIEILLSDQGSTDGTTAILEEAARTYNGLHKVRFIQCPILEPRGMAGLNTHINWTMTQTDADVVCQLSADDFAMQGRVQQVLDAFEAHKPSMVLTGMFYVSEDLQYLGESMWPDKDGWCEVAEMYPKFVGGSASQAWSHSFWDRMGPLEGVGSQDVVMPFVAACTPERAYYLHARLHAYRKVADLNNTGLEGILHAVPESSHTERVALEELIHFQVIAGHYAALRKLDHMGLRSEAANQALAQAILDRAASWTHIRERMSLERIPPRPFKA